MKDIEYKTFSVRLSDENINWLREENKKHKSWNKLFNKLREKNSTADYYSKLNIKY